MTKIISDKYIIDIHKHYYYLKKKKMYKFIILKSAQQKHYLTYTVQQYN
jgi:hypothetical protein